MQAAGAFDFVNINETETRVERHQKNTTFKDPLFILQRRTFYVTLYLSQLVVSFLFLKLINNSQSLDKGKSQAWGLET